jgi:kynurenine formamidase
VFRDGFPTYGPVFASPTRTTLATVERDGFYAQEWRFVEHVGTHLDAPRHFFNGGRAAPEISPEELIVPAVVIDISSRAADDPDAFVVVDDLARFEKEHGRVPDRAAVLMYSGWEGRVGSEDAYRNIGADGKRHFPGFGLEAVTWLLEERDVACIGVDTLSLDHGPSETFDVHRLLLGADRYGLENLAALQSIPPTGATILVGLVPWEEGSGGPCRVLARW